MAGALQDKVGLVTGAASGIGRGIATELAREGARVLLADLDTDRGEDAARALADEGHDAGFVRVDLAASDGPDRLLDAAYERLGNLSILVHSASPRRPEEETVFGVSDDAWEQMLNVNLHAGFRLGRRVGRQMVDAGLRGRLLFITSLHAHTPRNLPHYSASKAGLTMVMKELARALGPHGIRVNAIAPGAIPGGGSQLQLDPATHGAIPLGRPGEPADVAGMAVALVCDRFSRYVTGTTVVVDGGLALHNWIPPRS